MLLHKKIKKALKSASLERFIANPRKTMKVTSDELVEVNKILKGFPRGSFLTLKMYSEDAIDWVIKNNEIGFQLWRDEEADKWFLQINNSQLKSAAWKKAYEQTYRSKMFKEQIVISFEDDYVEGYTKLLNTTLVVI